LLARGEALEVIKNHGLRSYLKGGRSNAEALHVHAIESLVEVRSPEIIVITVKNYDLDPVAHDLRAQARAPSLDK
jgi:ketopantoate reductase